MRTFITPYNMGSESARELARRLGVLRIKGHKILPRNTTVINWGRSELPLRTRGAVTVLNKPEAVDKARNKLTALTILKSRGVNVPEFTTSVDVVRGWLSEESFAYGRKYVESQQGKGIVIITADSYDIPRLPLYTKAISKAYEFRVHVAGSTVIDFSKKKRRSGGESNPYIKNSDNGWVFCRQDEVLPDMVRQEAIKAVSALGLNFGAVDVLFKERDSKVFVLEVNTAPGLEGTTLDRYSEYFRRFV